MYFPMALMIPVTLEWNLAPTLDLLQNVLMIKMKIFSFATIQNHQVITALVEYVLKNAHQDILILVLVVPSQFHFLGHGI